MNLKIFFCIILVFLFAYEKLKKAVTLLDSFGTQNYKQDELQKICLLIPKKLSSVRAAYMIITV